MSAYIVEENVIQYIVSRARDLGMTAHIQELGGVNKVGQMLWDENARSVNWRYNDGEAADQFRFKGSRYAADLGQDLQTLANYRYQACEHDGWKASAACKFVEEMQRAVIDRLTRDKVWGAPNPIA